MPMYKLEQSINQQTTEICEQNPALSAVRPFNIKRCEKKFNQSI